MWGPVNRLGLTARAGLGGYPRRRKRAVGRDPDFEGCPNYLGARELVERVAADLGIEAEVRLVEVQTPADAQRLRFLGSPTIRLNGRDVEPDADKRREFAHSCRVYRTVDGFAGQPSERWVREALADTHAD